MVTVRYGDRYGDRYGGRYGDRNGHYLHLGFSFLFFVTISRHSGTWYMIFDWKDGEKVLDLGEPSFQTKPICWFPF